MEISHDKTLPRNTLNSYVNFFVDGVLCFNIKKEELKHYQEMMTELEKAGDWICMSKESSPFYAAEDMPSDCWGFVYKVSKN